MGLLSAIAGPLIGGLFSSKSQKKQNDANVENTLLQLPRLRQSAEDAGFNPLTALMSGASGGFNVQTRHAPLASAGAITNALEGVDDILSGKKARDRERQQVVDDLNKLNLERAKAGSAGGVATKTSSLSPLPHSRSASIAPKVATLGVKPAVAAPISLGSARPQSRPNLFSDGMTPVIGVDGSNKQIPSKLADRLKLNNWDAMIVEDYEALAGDVGGQIVASPQIPNAMIAVEGGLTKQRTAKEREEMLANPWNINKHDENRDGRGERKRRRDKKKTN